MNIKLFGAFALACLACLSSADVALTERFSHVNYSTFMGAAGEEYIGGDALETSVLLPSDSFGTTGSDHAAGYYAPADLHWNATVEWEVTQQYAITGPITDLSAIDASLRSQTTSIEQNATSQVSSADPGNVLSLTFTSNQAQEFLLTGSTSHIGPSNRDYSALYLFRMDGSTPVLMDIQTDSTFHRSYNLGAGSYMLTAVAFSAATGDETGAATLNYHFEAVPEPMTLLALGIGAVAALRQRR